jgi:hypothetical protein
MRLITALGVWTFALLFVRITCLQSCKPYQAKPEHLNKQLVGYKLFDMIVISHHECAKECMLLGACVSINFITSTKTCEFNSAGSETVPSSDFKKTKGIIFSDISEWPKVCGGIKCKPRVRLIKFNQYVNYKTIGNKQYIFTVYCLLSRHLTITL